MKRWWLLSMGCLSLTGALSFGWADDEKGEKEKSDRPVIKAREEVRKDGDREAPRKDGDKGREEARKKDGDREDEKEGVRREGERKADGDKPRDGERKAEGEKSLKRDGEKPRDGEVKKGGEGDRPREKAPESGVKKPHPEEAAKKKPQSEVGPLHHRLGELHAQLKKAAEAGREEDVARLKREIGELQRAHHPEAGERGERIRIAAQRLMEASEHLRAAGMIDAAESINRQAKEIITHFHATGGKGEPPRPEHTERRHDDRLEDIGAALRKLNERLAILQLPFA